MAWREHFMRWFGPGGLSGITFGDWLHVLRENHFAVNIPYLGRALAITASSVRNSFHRRREEKQFGAVIAEAEIQPPLFVLGVWRSGTTHLHNLLACDDRFAYPNTYQTFFPHTFLVSETRDARNMQFFMPATRPQDNVRLGVEQPQEDEFALLSQKCLSFTASWIFPQRAEHYDRFLTFQRATDDEVDRWKSGLLRFVRKLSYKYNRPLVLKSPAHMGRIRLLLELFPHARFVLIHRNPYEVFVSTLHTARKVLPLWALQHYNFDDLHHRTLEKYQELTDAYFDQRALIPTGRLCEVAFADLEREPIGTLRHIYAQLNLPPFSHAEPAMQAHLESVAGYEKNKLAPIDLELQTLIARHWQRSFAEWNYPTK